MDVRFGIITYMFHDQLMYVTVCIGNAFQVGGATETVVEQLVSPPVVNTVQEINMQGPYASLTRETTETSMHTTHNYDPTHIIERSTGTIMEECVDPPIIADCVYEQMQQVQPANVVEGAQSPNVGKINEMESFILSGENENPFTYIYSMLIGWGRQQDTKAYIQGKIKVHFPLLFI